MVRVLIVDDSAMMRELLGQILSSDPDIEVVGMASDPIVAREMIKALSPDVLTLDIEMPRLDGLAFLERIMQLRPMPVVMISALTQDGADVTLQALEMGAVDFIAKPRLDLEHGWMALRDEVITKVKSANLASIRMGPRMHRRPSKKERARGFEGASRIVAIGASTGGVSALMEILSPLPDNGPPILIAQHMPAAFTRQFARRLDACCAMMVVEATDHARVQPGHVYVAPGDRHLSLFRSGSHHYCRLDAGERVNGHIPAVDVLFASVSVAAGADAVGILLTGMGKDGARGLSKMRRAGAATACQDEASCVVYGMPKAAMAIGAAERELPLSKIAAYILEEAGPRLRQDRQQSETSDTRVHSRSAGPK